MRPWTKEAAPALSMCAQVRIQFSRFEVLTNGGPHIHSTHPEGWPVYRLPVDRVDGRPFGRRVYHESTAVYRSLPVDRNEPTTPVYR